MKHTQKPEFYMIFSGRCNSTKQLGPVNKCVPFSPLIKITTGLGLISYVVSKAYAPERVVNHAFVE